jgi:hypothetical protein
MRLLLVLLGLVACRVTGIDVAGKACPCPSGWYCDPASNTCTATEPVDAYVPGEPQMNVTTYRDAVIADTPVSYWRLDDADTSATDQMGRHDGTYGGTCVHGVSGALVGDSNTAVQFDGSSCKVILPSAFVFPALAPFSVEAWTAQPVLISGYRIVWAESTRDVNGPIDGYNVVDSSTGVYVERAINKSTSLTARTMHPFGEFVHLVAVYDGASVVMYVNAVPTAAVADTRVMPTYSAAALIGADSVGNYFSGTIDEVAVYDHVLTADQVMAHYKLGTLGPQ